MDIDKILKKILQIDDLVSQKHSHSNKNILDSITQALINNWNNAYTHISDTVKHITSTERTNWNDADSKKHVHSNKSILDSISQSNLNNWDDKYTQNEVDNKISQVVSNMDWKESVATYADIATTYPTPDDGWTVNVKDTDITYRYNGSSWIPISANSIPLASSSVDGKMSKQDKIDHDDMNSKKHIHANKSILDTITQALIDGWNSAFTHISDTVKHITSTERSNWNTAYNNNHNHGNKTILDSITQALIDSWNSAFSHISDTIKHITSDERSLWNTVSNKVDKITGKSLSTNDFDNTYKSKIDGISSNANKVEVSTTNGNIKVDGAEKTVYVHPSGTNPHGTTKADVGLSNVDNTSDLNKPISTAVQSALNGKANSSHTHDDRYYTETEANSKFATKDEISTAGYGDMLKSVYDTDEDGIVDKAKKLATARKINLNGDVIGNASFDGSQDISIVASSRQIVFVGSDSANSNGWYKVASQTMSGYGNTNIMFAVYSTYGTYYGGILQLQMRTDSTSISCPTFKWLNRYGFNTNHFMIVINGMTWTLYAYRDFGQYGRLAFEILSQSCISNKNQGWTLNFSDNNTVESTIPTATVTSSDGSTVNVANKLAVARTVILTGEVTGSTSFDGSGNVSIATTVTDDSHNHTISTITNFASGVIGTVLNGLSIATNTAISATDSILSALGKLQAQITTNLATLNNHAGNMSNPHKTTAEQIGLGNVNNTSDLNKPISTATQTALDGKANSSHTHNYAGSSTAGGSANSAVKLDTARKINGANFDGSGDITIYDNTKLPLTGGTITGRTLFNQGISVININGGAGTAGFMYLAQIKVNSSYQNQPIVFDIHQRERFGTIIIKFNSQNTSDPTLAYINKIGNINAYIYKSATSTWDLYIQKSEGYDSIDIVGFSKGDYMNSTSVTWQSSTATSLPTGYIEATIATIDIISTRANQDSDGKPINTTYVKKNCTWNDLKGV